MLLMVEKDIWSGICNTIHQFTKASKKHMKDYDRNKESSYIKYWDAGNLCGWALSKIV